MKSLPYICSVIKNKNKMQTLTTNIEKLEKKFKEAFYNYETSLKKQNDFAEEIKQKYGNFLFVPRAELNKLNFLDNQTRRNDSKLGRVTRECLKPSEMTTWILNDWARQVLKEI